MRRRAIAVAVGLAGVAASLAPTRAAAQDAPPGSALTRAGRFEVVAFPDEARLARAVLDAATARDTWPGLPPLRDTVRIMLAPDGDTFRAWAGEGAPDWGGAFAFPGERRIIMQGRDGAARDGDPLVTLRHELAHLALHEHLGGRVPRWFDEGYASFAAGEWGREEVLATSVGLIWRGVPSLAGLDSLFGYGPDRAQRAYALAHRAVAELAAMGGERGLELLLTYWREDGAFEPALRRAYGMTGSQFEARFRSAVRRQYGLLALATDLSVLSVLLVFLLGPLWWQRRQRLRARLAQMRRVEEAAAARERESALAALLGEGPPPRPPEAGG